MSYTLLFQPGLKRDLNKLPSTVIGRVDAKILLLAENPRPIGTLKLSGSSNAYRLRVGDWRILYEIDDASRSVLVTAVAHRRESYR